MPITYVSNHTAILGYFSWAQSVPNSPTVLTYSFSEQAEDPGYFATPDTTSAGFVPFTTYQEGQTRAALALWAETSGVTFVEVEAGQGDLTFGNYALPEGSYGSATAPLRSVNDYRGTQGENSGQIRIDVDHMNDTNDYNRYALLHEIGQALGLIHPHEGNVQLTIGDDNTHFTVMSYNGRPATELGAYDVRAMAALYGPADMGPTQDGGLHRFELDEAALSLHQLWGGQSSEIWGSSLEDHIQAGAGADTVA